MELFSLFIGTLKLRPYVFIFLIFYLLTAIRLLGWQRTTLFTAVCWLLAFLSEFSSTRNGFPYGWYHYIETTRAQELWIFNVPFMDSLSYTFLNFAAFTVALFCFHSAAKGKLHLPETFKKPWSLAALSALLVTYLDIIIDPIAHQGDKWFLGKIYYYPNPGPYFEIPLSNFLGWFLVGFLSIRIYLYGEKFLPPRDAKARDYALPFGDLWGPLLYLGVVLFNLAVTFFIGDMHLFYAGTYITLLPLIFWILLLRRAARS